MNTIAVTIPSCVTGTSTSTDAAKGPPNVCFVFRPPPLQPSGARDARSMSSRPAVLTDPSDVQRVSTPASKVSDSSVGRGFTAISEESAERPARTSTNFPSERRVNRTLPDLTSRRVAPASTVILKEVRSEEHTSELQSQSNLVCRLLLEKKKQKTKEVIAKA